MVSDASQPDQSLSSFVRRLESFGDNVAIRYRTQYRGFAWSYRWLCSSVVSMASFLEDKGVGRGERVLIWAPNSPAWVVAFLGCLASGRIAVPLDVRSQPEFVREVAQETSASLLVRGRYQPDLELGARAVVAEDLPEFLSHLKGPDRPLPDLKSSSVAEIVYTSGTTARPKGVILTHGNLASELESIQPLVPREPAYRFLAVLPLSHIFGQMIDLLLPLSRGGTVVLLETVKPSAIATALRRERITAFPVVPRMLELLADDVRRGASSHPLIEASFALALKLSPRLSADWRRRLFLPVHGSLGGELKYLVSGGASLDPALERFWDDLGFAVLQGYGLTETSSAVTATRIDARRSGSVGLPLPGQQVKLSQNDEVIVSGPNVTPGYFANPEATEAAFEDAWLRTGDVGRFDEDGFLYIKGRLKEMIVTSAGVNVYPEDVEASLGRQPGVRDSAVVEWRGAIHAVLLLQPGADARRVVEAANQRLDSAQQIQGYTVWPYPDFPRTPTLKARKRDVLAYLDSHRLPKESVEQVKGAAGSVASLVADVAHTPTRDLRPDMSLGLDLKLSSIDRLELISLVEQSLNVDLADDEVTADMTVGELERLVEAKRPAARLAFPRWARSPLVRGLRDVLQLLLLFPVLRFFFDVSVVGREHLSQLEGPCIFASNHQTYLDPAVVEMALPDAQRQRLAVAAWAEYFEAPGYPWHLRVLRRVEYLAIVLLVSAFPLPQARIARSSVQYMGEMVEEGDSILIFPEGRRTLEERIEPFKEGIGLITAALRVPVVPVRLKGLPRLLPLGKHIPRHGPVTVTFGPPLLFREDESYVDITRRVQQAVSDL